MLSVKRITQFLIDNRQGITLVLFITCFLFIIYYTLLCREVGDEHAADLRLMWAYREMFSGHPEWKEDVGYNIKNILFFIPFGLWFPDGIKLLPAFKDKHWLLTLFAGMLFSVFIEVTQYIACCGLCETDDVLCNGLGALIDYWIFLALRKLHANTKRLTNNIFKELAE